MSFPLQNFFFKACSIQRRFHHIVLLKSKWQLPCNYSTRITTSIYLLVQGNSSFDWKEWKLLYDFGSSSWSLQKHISIVYIDVQTPIVEIPLPAIAMKFLSKELYRCSWDSQKDETHFCGNSETTILWLLQENIHTQKCHTNAHMQSYCSQRWNKFLHYCCYNKAVCNFLIPFRETEFLAMICTSDRT